MLQARSSDPVGRVDKVKGPRGTFHQVAFIFVSTLVLMTVYETAKSLMFPGISLWQSHLATIIVTSIVATAAGFVAYRKIRYSEGSYHRFVAMAPEAVWVHQNGTIVIANQACATLFGAADPDDLFGKQVIDFAHPEDRDTVRARIQNPLERSKSTRHYETRYIRLDAKEINVEVIVCPIVYRGGAASLVMFHDIMERKKAEQRLRESEANLAAAQRIAHLGSWTADLDDNGRVDESRVRWSDEIFRILGLEIGRRETTRADFFRAVHPDDAYRIHDTVAKALRLQTGVSVEYRILRPDGSERKIQGHVDVACDPQTKKPLRIEGTVQDVTEWKQAEEKIAQLALIVESSDDAISSVALDGTILSWNKGAERIYGYSAAEAIGRSITLLSPPDRPTEIPSLLGRLRQGERIPPFETTRIRKGGQPIDIFLTISAVKDPYGNIMGTAAVARDMTAHKREEERSRRLAQLVDSATELISTGDCEGRITFMNQAFLAAIGWSEAEVIGKHFRDVVLSPNTPPDLRERIRAGAMEGKGWQGECLHRRKDGSDFPVYLSLGPLRDSAGRVIGNVGIVRDLTESKRAEERFYKAFHLNPEPITLATLAEGRYLDVNESFLRITGYRREEVIGRTSLELRFWEKTEDRERLIEILREQGSVRDLEITFRTKANERRVALDSADVIELNGQNCVIAILKDITDRKSLENQLRQLQKMEAIGQLSGGIAHDFNNLLGVILGYSEFLEEHLEKDSRFLKTAREITKARQRATSLTRQLLAFSRQQLLEPKVLNLNTVVADTEKMLRRLIGEHIFITSDLAPDLGPVVADQGQIEQVVMNLAVNARDAMPEGGKLIIETRNVELDELYALHHPPTVPGKYIELVMTDSGVGMDAQTLSHIFEPFFTTKELGKGTGLGLATVYGVVKQSGGYIWVYSEPGIGTTFKIYLPRVAESVRQTGSGQVAAHGTPARGSETILLVEDEEALRTLTRSVLENNGYTVLEASGGREAIEIARTHPQPIDLLLTDIVMPEMNGRTLARSLTRLIPGLKIVYMSGYTGFGHHGFAEPEETLLAKPITRDVLLRKLHEVLHVQNSPVA